MNPVSSKTSFALISVGIAAVLLCMWNVAPRQPARALPQDSPLLSAVHPIVKTSPASVSLAPASSRSEDLVQRDFIPRASTIDEALRRLEQDLRHAAQIADEGECHRVLAVACLNWAEHDPADALRLARKLGLDETSHSLFEDVVQKWATTDFPAALSWANCESAGDQRDRLMARLAFVRSQTQPNAAAQLVVEQIPSGPIQAEAGIAVLHQWALRDFDGALAWVNRFPAELQNRARAELAGIASYRLPRSEAP